MIDVQGPRCGPCTRKRDGRLAALRAGADIGVRGRGATLDEAFAQAATALTAVVTDPGLVRPVEAVHVHCQVADPEVLFFEWLNTLVFHMATRRMLFSRFEVRVTGDRLEAEGTARPSTCRGMRPRWK